MTHSLGAIAPLPVPAQFFDRLERSASLSPPFRFPARRHTRPSSMAGCQLIADEAARVATNGADDAAGAATKKPSGDVEGERRAGQADACMGCP